MDRRRTYLEGGGALKPSSIERATLDSSFSENRNTYVEKLETKKVSREV